MLAAPNLAIGAGFVLAIWLLVQMWMIGIHGAPQALCPGGALALIVLGWVDATSRTRAP